MSYETFQSHNAVPPIDKQLPPPRLINTQSGLLEIKPLLESTHRLAIDTESNSLYAYYERICLIQISTDQADFLIDPLALPGEDIQACLSDIFSNPDIEKVFHAAEYDIMGLRRDFDFEFANVFDTMLATRNLGWKELGLAALLKEYFGVQVRKRHQKDNWGRRPLTPDLMDYAQMDTHYLLALRDHLFEALQRAELLDEAIEVFHEITQARWNGGKFDPEGFWQINGARALSSQKQAVLQYLYLCRDGLARRANVPVFKIMSDQTLVSLAKFEPLTLTALGRVAGIGENTIRRHGRDILKAIEQGLESPAPKIPARRQPPDEQILRRFDALHHWRKEAAAQRGVSSEVILSKDALWALASEAPQTWQGLQSIDHIGDWRLQKYGEQILNILNNL
jgi:ribonuclease D